MSYNFDTDQNHYYFNNKNSLPIIFIHGVGLNQQMWKPQIEFFKDNSFITYDLLGHGKTPFNSQELTMENFTDQLSNLVNNLNIEKFNLIGFSIGVELAQLITVLIFLMLISFFNSFIKRNYRIYLALSSFIVCILTAILYI